MIRRGDSRDKGCAFSQPWPKKYPTNTTVVAHRPAQDAVEGERAPAHAAYAGHQRFEQAGDREEAAREDGVTPVAFEELFDPIQALGGEAS